MAENTFDARTEEVELPEPEPLYREPPGDLSYPLDALCALEAPTRAIADDLVQCPTVIAAHSLLAVASLTAQGDIVVKPPHGSGNETIPPSLYLLTFARSGERKSTADREAIWPLREFERLAIKNHDQLLLPAYKRQLAAWKTIDKKGKDHGPEPVKPVYPIMYADDPTIEFLVKLYRHGSRSLGLFATEGGKFIGGFSMKDDAKVSTGAKLSSLWDGEPFRAGRAGDPDDPTVLDGCALSIHLMLQPELGMGLYRDRVLTGQGFLSRCLIGAPKSLIGDRPFKEPGKVSLKAMGIYNEKISDLLRDAAEDSAKGRKLFKMTFTEKAKNIWKDYYDDHEQRMKSELLEVVDYVNKMPEQVIRLSAVLAHYKRGTSQIKSEEVEAAIELGDHYVAEHKRLRATACTNPELLLAEQALKWLRERWKKSTITLRAFYQRGPIGIRVRNDAVRIVGILEEHKYLIRLSSSRDDWRVNLTD